MTIHKVKSFNLKEKDFASGKMISPPREFWKTCACCGKAIVKGAVMSNGDLIGDDCENVVMRVRTNAMYDRSSDGLFRMFGTPKRVQQYAIACSK